MTAECVQAASFFLPGLNVVALKPLGGGIVNETWLLTLQSDEKYVLQRLNPFVFPDPSLIV